MDPGVTTAYVLLDIRGTILKYNAKKNFPTEEIILEIRGYKIAIIATDKSNIPEKVKEIASKINARIVNPSKDLSIEEKKELTRGYNFEGKEKEHLLDALAAAKYALEKHKKLIEKTLQKYGYNEDILYLVLRSGNLNPEAAYIKIKKIKEIKKKIKKKYENEYIKILEEENRILRNKLRKIKKYLKAYKELKSLKSLINNLHREIESLKSEKELIERELFKLFINYMLNKRIIPKYEYAKKYNIPYFYTDNLDIVKKYASIGKYKIYISKKLETEAPMSKNIFVLDDYEETYLFVFFEKARKLEKIEKKEDILKKIVEEYRQKKLNR